MAFSSAVIVMPHAGEGGSIREADETYGRFPHHMAYGRTLVRRFADDDKGDVKKLTPSPPRPP